MVPVVWSVESVVVAVAVVVAVVVVVVCVCAVWCGTLKTPVCRIKSSPCVNSKRPRVCRHHAHMLKLSICTATRCRCSSPTCMTIFHVSTTHVCDVGHALVQRPSCALQQSALISIAEHLFVTRRLTNFLQNTRTSERGLFATAPRGELSRSKKANQGAEKHDVQGNTQKLRVSAETLHVDKRDGERQERRH